MKKTKILITLIVSIATATLAQASTQGLLPIQDRGPSRRGINADSFIVRETRITGMVERMNTLASDRSEVKEDVSILDEGGNTAFQVATTLRGNKQLIVTENVILPIGIITLSIIEGRNLENDIIIEEERTYEYDTNTGKVTWTINGNDHEITREEYGEGTDENRQAIEEMIEGIKQTRNDIANTLDRERLQEIKMRLIEVLNSQG